MITLLNIKTQEIVLFLTLPDLVALARIELALTV